MWGAWHRLPSALALTIPRSLLLGCSSHSGVCPPTQFVAFGMRRQPAEPHAYCALLRTGGIAKSYILLVGLRRETALTREPR